MEKTVPGPIPSRIGIALSLILFGVPAAVLWLASHLFVPALTTRGWEPLAAWFAAGTLVFAPLLAAAIGGAALAVSARRPSAILEDLRVRRLSGRDWKITLTALAVTLAFMAGLQAVNANLWPQLPPHPPFLTVKPLEAAQYYLFALWIPFFFLNIVGEELWWRGFIQPRQEPVFGTYTWIVQGILHGAFHVSFGPGVMFILWPVLFAIPWAVQRTKNTSAGMVVHATVNGVGFLGVTLDLLPV